MRARRDNDGADTPLDVLTRSFHGVTVFVIALLTSTCLPALALAPSARDLQMSSGGALAAVWFLWRLSFVGFSRTRAEIRMQRV